MTAAKATSTIDAASITTRSSSVKVYTALISPGVATEWLGKNSHNRTLRNATFERLAQAIRRGEWVLNGDAIRFDVNDVLVDGQHRLWAIATAETPVASLVITGLPPTAQETMDVGARRNLKDALSLRGERDPLGLAAAVAYLWKQENGYLRTGVAPTIQQGIALLDEHPGLRDACRDVRSLRRRFRLSEAMSAVVRYTLDTIDSEAALAFFTKLYEGADLSAGDPVLVLRQYLEAQSALGVGMRSQSIIHHAIIIKAWNAWREGRQIDRLNWKSGGMKAEKFPEPHG